jgi:hypothetical protein
MTPSKSLSFKFRHNAGTSSTKARGLRLFRDLHLGAQLLDRFLVFAMKVFFLKTFSTVIHSIRHA